MFWLCSFCFLQQNYHPLKLCNRVTKFYNTLLCRFEYFLHERVTARSVGVADLYWFNSCWLLRLESRNMNAHTTSSLSSPILLAVLIFLPSVVFPRWPGDSTGGVVSKAGSVPHPIWGGGKGLPPCPRTAPASHCLLELPWEWGRHQVRTLMTWIFSSPLIKDVPVDILLTIDSWSDKFNLLIPLSYDGYYDVFPDLLQKCLVFCDNQWTENLCTLTPNHKMVFLKLKWFNLFSLQQQAVHRMFCSLHWFYCAFSRHGLKIKVF